jgi:uncharacterized protein (DUF2336 family)
MTGTLPLINIQDVLGLRSDPSEQGRMAIIKKVTSHYSRSTSLTDVERELAEEIIKIAAHDVASVVKETLIEQLRECKDIPATLVSELLNNVDIKNIVAPFLQSYQGFSDDDLLDIIATHCPQRQKAIANRQSVSERLSDKLIEDGIRTVINALTANQGAIISARGYYQIYEKFKNDVDIKRNLCFRASLPIALAERLVTEVSMALREQLLLRYKISPTIAKKATLYTQEKVTLFLAHPSTPITNLQKLMRHLQDSKRLTDALLMRAICMGDIRFFNYAVAERANIPVSVIQKIHMENNEKDMRFLLVKAAISSALHAPIMIGIQVYREASQEIDMGDIEAFSRRVIERFLTQFPAVGSKSIDDLLDKLHGCSRNSAYLM